MKGREKMKKKNIIILIFIAILILGAIILYLSGMVELTNEQDEIHEYVPEAEITDEQLRATVVSLYFLQKEDNKLIPEARSIDVKELTKEPYITLMNLLIGGPKNEKLVKTIPDETKVNTIKINKNILTIDLSKEFIENHVGGAEAESKTIYSIVNTMTQLNEVEAVKITIDGDENSAFKDGAIKFTEAFVRQE